MRPIPPRPSRIGCDDAERESVSMTASTRRVMSAILAVLTITRSAPTVTAANPGGGSSSSAAREGGQPPMTEDDLILVIPARGESPDIACLAVTLTLSPANPSYDVIRLNVNTLRATNGNIV